MEPENLTEWAVVFQEELEELKELLDRAKPSQLYLLEDFLLRFIEAKAELERELG